MVKGGVGKTTLATAVVVEMAHRGLPVHLSTPMVQLQDTKQTKVVIVTLAETTPVLEASNLQADLRRVAIEPWAWIINTSVAAANPPCCASGPRYPARRLSVRCCPTS